MVGGYITVSNMQFAVVIYKKGQFGNQPVNWINVSIWMSRHDILVQAIHLILQLGGIIYDYLFVSVHLIACTCVCVWVLACLCSCVCERTCVCFYVHAHACVRVHICPFVSLYCNVFQQQTSINGVMALSRFTDNGLQYQRGLCSFSGQSMPTTDGDHVYNLRINRGENLFAGQRLTIR